ncbi:MAG: hypothetical protein ACYS9Y_08285 [Planctomycetota bacterium]
MFEKLKKSGLGVETKIFTVSWYPNARSCVNKGDRKVRLQQMPPLMVRKAEWRR